MTKRTCSIEGCEKPAIARGWCATDYDRMRRKGFIVPATLPTVEERFWAKVDKDGPIPEYAPHLGNCWIWTAATVKEYGSFVGEHAPGERGDCRAHRWIYIHVNGPIDPKDDVDHLCRVKGCVRPSHLEAVSHRENMLRSPIAQVAINARKTHCMNGHDLSDPANCTIRINKNGHPYRVCRPCAVDSVRKWRTRRRAAGLPIK